MWHKSVSCWNVTWISRYATVANCIWVYFLGRLLADCTWTETNWQCFSSQWMTFIKTVKLNCFWNMWMLFSNIIKSIVEQNPPVCVCSCSWGVTWRLSGAGLQGAGLFGHRFGEGVAASDQLPALVTLDVPHPHTHTARLRALRKQRSKNTVVTLRRAYICPFCVQIGET